MLTKSLGLQPIEVIYDPPPIPIRQFDYIATFPNGDEHLVGYGPTPQLAIIDLLEHEVEHDDLNS
jgi:hypothetical protein